MFGMLVDLVGMFGDGVYSAISGVVSFFLGVIGDSLMVLINALPDDPFILPQVVGTWDTAMSWLNWFVPITGLVELLGIWASATLTYYVGRWALRTWVNMHG